jgi:hypothetical protein
MCLGPYVREGLEGFVALARSSSSLLLRTTIEANMTVSLTADRLPVLAANLRRRWRTMLLNVLCEVIANDFQALIQIELVRRVTLDSRIEMNHIALLCASEISQPTHHCRTVAI